jgi:hypothetical protein
MEHAEDKIILKNVKKYFVSLKTECLRQYWAPKTSIRRRLNKLCSPLNATRIVT